MRYSPARLLANAIFVFSMSLLIAVGVWYLAADSGQSEPASVHLTQASWQVGDATAFNAPPAKFDSKTLPGQWHDISLPLSLPLAEKSEAHADHANKVRATWIKLSLDGSPLPSDALVLYGVRIKTEGTVAIYANGRLVHRAQEQGPLWNSLFTPLWVTVIKIATAHP